jgi:phospholipid transport system substrate-binding protein
MTFTSSSTLIRFLVTIVAVAALTSTAAASEGSATRSVKAASETLSKLLRRQVKANSAEEKQLAGQVTRELRGFLDVDELGRLALTAHWDKLSQTERSEYLRLLRTLIEANYIKGLRANLDYRTRYTGERPRGEKRVVTTEILAVEKGRKTTIEIEYLLRREGTGWRAVDIITDGVGLVENYRAQFNRIIAKEGMDGLLGRMRKKLASI